MFKESKSFVQYLFFHDKHSTRWYKNATAYAPVIGFALGSHALDIGRDRRDPYGVESHALDVVKMVRDPLPRATTIGAFASIAGNCRVIGSGEPVCDELRVSLIENAHKHKNSLAGYLIDGSRAPFCGIR